MPGIRTAQQAPEDLADYNGNTLESTSPARGHGTPVASVAAGLTLGVASNAKLMLIKWQNGFQSPVSPTFSDGSPKFILAPAKPSAFVWAWRKAIDDVKQNHATDPSTFTKAVINFSAGTFFSP
jgi:hypothetical protein